MGYLLDGIRLICVRQENSKETFRTRKVEQNWHRVAQTKSGALGNRTWTTGRHGSRNGPILGRKKLSKSLNGKSALLIWEGENGSTRKLQTKRLRQKLPAVSIFRF